MQQQVLLLLLPRTLLLVQRATVCASAPHTFKTLADIHSPGMDIQL
jgi:hypothetical protein